MKFDRKQHFSLRKYKSVGLASAVVGLSMLGATGALDNVPVLNNLFAVETAYAFTPGDSGEVMAYYKGRWVGTVKYTVDSFGYVQYDLPTGWSINGAPTNGRYGPLELLTYPEESGSSSSGDSTPAPSTPSAPVGNPGAEYDSSEGITIGTTPETYQADPTKPAGEKTLITQGKPARKRYHSDDGRTYRYVTDPSVPSVFSVGTKPNITETPINFTTRYIADKTRTKGAENVTQTEGKAGKVVKTVSYKLDTETGTVRELPATETRTEPTNKVVKVAAKNKVETIQRGRQTVENETQIYKIVRAIGFLFCLNLSASTTCYTLIKLTKYHKTTSKQKKRGKLVYFPLSCTNLFESLF